MATFCNQTLNGLGISCDTSLGGIKEVYIANYADVSKVTLDEVSGEITDIEMVGEAKFMPYSFRKQTGSMTSTLNVDETNGVNYVSTELNLVFTKLETVKRVQMSALSQGQLAVIVKDSNNKYWYLGYDDYVSATAGTGETGTAKGDRNAYTITLRDESDTYPYNVQESAVSPVMGTLA